MMTPCDLRQDSLAVWPGMHLRFVLRGRVMSCWMLDALSAKHEQTCTIMAERILVAAVSPSSSPVTAMPFSQPEHKCNNSTANSDDPYQDEYDRAARHF
jgi:hypothetical protein